MDAVAVILVGAGMLLAYWAYKGTLTPVTTTESNLSAAGSSKK